MNSFRIIRQNQQICIALEWQGTLIIQSIHIQKTITG